MVDPSGLKCYDVAIVGGGFAGTTVACELARITSPGQSVVLFDGRKPGPGTAYEAKSDLLYMNGKASAMSAVPDDKLDLVRWLKADCGQVLISRRQFGRYLVERFEGALNERPDFEVCRSDVIDMVAVAQGWTICDRDGRTHLARCAVLALGNFTPDDSFLPPEIVSHDRFVADPWNFSASDIEGDVLIIGSRLTALDAIALLEESGYSGKIHLVSRHGLMPCLEETSAAGLPTEALSLQTDTPYALLRSLRREARRYVQSGGDWRDVVETVRNMSPSIWREWSLRQRRQFLRHLEPFWAVHRYRSPPQTAELFEQVAKRQSIVRHRGRISGARRLPYGRLSVEISNHSKRSTIAVGSIINCTGPNQSYERITHPLVQNLLHRGIIRADPLGLGLDATPELRVIDREGQAQDGLFSLGPPVRGLWYETTAVPETRAQAAAVARMLAFEQAQTAGKGP
jgi:uncharacterized NAD(P)/FAD-binding protein YdhS